MDHDTKTLHIWFSDEGRQLETTPGVIREISIPSTKSIAAGEELPLKAKVPLDLTRIVPHEDKSFHLEALDLTEAVKVELYFAVGEKPFYASRTRKDILSQLAEWGEKLKFTSEISSKPLNKG